MSAHEITTAPAGSRIRVEIDGEVVAESDDAIALREAGLPTRYYLPAHDVRGDVLRESDTHTTCPWKGEASYHSVVTPSGEHTDLVWYYPEPREGVADIRDRLAFFDERASVFVDGEPVG